MNTISNDIVSITELPAILTELFERAQRPLLPGVQGQTGLFVRYLRRKPERGLAVIYHVDEIRKQSNTSRAPDRSVSLTLDEQALDGARMLFTSSQAVTAPLTVQPSGVLRLDDIGLSVQAFPADSHLPTLAASCDTTPRGLLFQALEQAARLQLADDIWKLLSAHAEPVRYKPANRCVIRYSLRLENSTTSEQKHLTIFGKVYANPAQARTVQEWIQQLHDEQLAGREQQSFLPCPLGIVASLGLTLNEAIEPAKERDEASADPWQHLRTGTRALQVQTERGRGGSVKGIVLPVEELQLTGRTLADLHTSSVYPNAQSPRTGAKEAKRALERAALIAQRNPDQADEAQTLAHMLAERLKSLTPEMYRPAHGGFKASQLLFHSHRVFVVDFDGFCCADPALDVGYFLAYLRPSGLWYQRPGTREWFEQAAQLFSNAYQSAMLSGGVSSDEVRNIMQRARLYEAALLFKIATRRVNRLNSPRPAELSAMLHEIAICLTER